MMGFWLDLYLVITKLEIYGSSLFNFASVLGVCRNDISFVNFQLILMMSKWWFLEEGFLVLMLFIREGFF